MRRLVLPALSICLLAAPALGSVRGEPKQPYQDRQDDTPRAQVEVITSGRHEYTVRFGGTVDGTMTRMSIGYAAFVQGWQPNRSVLIENVGQTDVVNPWLVANGRGDWRTLSSIVAEATRGYVTPADKARAIWEFVRRQRFHACTWDGECSDALKALNVYGYTLCGNQARVITDLWRAAGLKTRRCRPVGHCVSQVFYDGRYHLMDSDEHVICLLRDNRTIASERDVVRDHDLIKRTHTYGIGHRDSRRTDEFSASLYGYQGSEEGTFELATHHSMDLTLRPGESIEFRWDHVGKQYSAGRPLKKGQAKRDGLGGLLASWGRRAYDNMRNGKLRYRPDLSSPTAQRGTVASDNVTFDTGSRLIRPDAVGKPAQVTWRFASPYVFVGGRASAAIEAGEQAAVGWRYSTDGKTWTTLADGGDSPSGSLAARLDDVISPRRKPTYCFWLQLSLRGDVAARQIAFEHDIQTATLGLPELVVGENRLVYTDASPEGRKVRITHRWLERTAWHPPLAPARAIAPADGAVVEGTRVRFVWSEPADPDGDAIVDYHFELSAWPDMRWPLSPNFEKRTSLTASRGKPEWVVPYEGLLNADTTYWWHVRALDSTGVWGPWSKTFRFQAHAPGVPLDVKLVPDGDGRLVLSWKANPQGRMPVAYKVYGSDEQGFTASDTPYVVFRGRGFVRTMDEYEDKPEDAADAGAVKVPANLIGRTSRTQMTVVGAGLTRPNTNKAFYRVVAIDAAGNQSGPSDYAEVPLPYVYSRPATPAKVGTPYRYQPAVICSIGDLRCRPSTRSSYNAAFWNRQQLTFEAIRLPEGLSLDPCSGLVSGVPARAGSFDLVFEVRADPGKTVTVAQQLQVTE